jgi:hypothetical protein
VRVKKEKEIDEMIKKRDEGERSIFFELKIKRYFGIEPSLWENKF